MKNLNHYKGIYAITPDSMSIKQICAQSEKLVDAGVKIIQVRSKHLNFVQKKTLATEILALTKAKTALCIINDDVQMAIEVGADGVHLGKEDTPLSVAKKTIKQTGTSLIIGATSYGKAEYLQMSERAGVDYVGIGSVYSSNTKQNANVIGISTLTRLIASTKLPVVALGGINGDNINAVINCRPFAIAASEWLYQLKDTTTIADFIEKIVRSTKKLNKEAKLRSRAKIKS